MDYAKLGLLLGGLAYQLDLITTAQLIYWNPAFEEFYITSGGDYPLKAAEAFYIIAFVTFVASFVFLLQANFTDLKGNKGVNIAAICSLLLGAASLIVAVSIHGHYADKGLENPRTDPSLLYPNTRETASYQTTAFMTASAAGIVGSIFLIMGLK